jgi:hypothetical protein
MEVKDKFVEVRAAIGKDKRAQFMKPGQTKNF